MAELDVRMPRDLQRDAARVDQLRMADAKAKVKDMDSPTRGAAALVMAVEGAAYPDIARVLDYRDARQAKEAVWAAVAAAGADHDDVERMRQLQSARLDRLLYSLMRRATKPADPDHLAYARMALAVMDRQAKLYGLDAAREMVVYTPTVREVNEYVARVSEALRVAAGAIEADIVDAEVVDG